MLSRIKRVLKRVKEKIFPGSRFWLDRESLLSNVSTCGDSLVLKGKVYVDDPWNLVLGNNVRIGSNVRIYCKGGVYIGDNVTLENNVIIGTSRKDRGGFSSEFDFLISLKPLVLATGASVKSGEHVTTSRQVNIGPEVLSDHKRRFFVLSTGRSGTGSISDALNGHSKIVCDHEFRPALNRISAVISHPESGYREVNWAPVVFNLPLSVDPAKWFGESDLKNSNLIPDIYKAFPQSKFIWLIRDASDFVSSAYGRAWFDDYEYSYPAYSRSSDHIADDSIFEPYRIPYSIYRFNGYRDGDLSREEWQAMGSFERACYYWAFWNARIESDLNMLGQDKWVMVKLEDMQNDLGKVWKLLDLNPESVKVKKSNVAYHSVHAKDYWDDKQREVFRKWCSPGMKKWYNVTL